MGAKLSEDKKYENFNVMPEEYKELTNNYLGFFMKHMVDMKLLPN